MRISYWNKCGAKRSLTDVFWKMDNYNWNWISSIENIRHIFNQQKQLRFLFFFSFFLSGRKQTRKWDTSKWLRNIIITILTSKRENHWRWLKRHEEKKIESLKRIRIKVNIDNFFFAFFRLCCVIFPLIDFIIQSATLPNWMRERGRGGRERGRRWEMFPILSSLKKKFQSFWNLKCFVTGRKWPEVWHDERKRHYRNDNRNG